MSSVPILVYFDFSGRAGATRLLFAIAGIAFEDKRVTGQDMAAMRAAGELPFGQLPILIVGDKVIAQSGAIVRYAAKIASIYPEDPLVAAYHDMLYEQCLDISNTVAGNFKLPEDARGPARQQLMSETWPRLFEALDRELVKNGGPFLTGNTISFPDCALVSIMEMLTSGRMPEVPVDYVTTRFPRFAELFAALYADERVAQYHAARRV